MTNKTLQVDQPPAQEEPQKSEHAVPPKLPKPEARGKNSAKSLGLRFSCGWSFETLDPQHHDPQKRRFVKCSKCGQKYLAVNWNGKCVRRNCNSDQNEPLKIPPPEPLIVSDRNPIPYNSGPLNSLTDEPLGISTGTLYFNSRETKRLIFRNNSERPIDLPASFGPSWFSVVWQESESERKPLSVSNDGSESLGDLRLVSNPHVTLNPDESITAVVRAHGFRPPRDDRYVPVYEDQGVQVPTHQEESLVWFVACSLLLLGGVHLVSSLIAVGARGWGTAAVPAFSGSLLLGLVATLCPKLLVQGARLLKLSLPADPAWTGISRSAHPVFLPRLALFLGVSAMLGCVFWVGYYLVGQMMGEPDFFAYLTTFVYGVIVFVLLEMWLRGYQVGITKIISSRQAKLSSSHKSLEE